MKMKIKFGQVALWILAFFIVLIASSTVRYIWLAGETEKKICNNIEVVKLIMEVKERQARQMGN